MKSENGIMNTINLEPDFRRIVKAIGRGKALSHADHDTVIAGLRRVISDRDYRAAYLEIADKFAQCEETIDDEHLRDAAIAGLEKLDQAELVLLVRSPVELLCLRDLVFERLRDPDIQLDESDHWLAVLWQTCESAGEKEGNLAESDSTPTSVKTLMVGPPPMDADKQFVLAAAPATGSEFVNLAVITINDVRCKFWKGHDGVYLSPIGSRRPRSIQFDSVAYNLIHDEESGWFRVCELDADVLVAISKDLSTNRSSHECKINFDE